jgi:hypothetical protein
MLGAYFIIQSNTVFFYLFIYLFLTSTVTDIHSLRTVLKHNSLALAAVATILNLAKIKINFALDEATIELAVQ